MDFPTSVLDDTGAEYLDLVGLHVEGLRSACPRCRGEVIVADLADST
ncbi:hypothetical protein [Haloarchaeobius iranensis]